MSKQCIGCGVTLQYENKEQLGYTPKEDSEYCQRCFRLTHYNDVVISMQKGIDNDTLLAKVNDLDALIVWVVDIIDFETSLLKGLNRHLLGKDIILVCTKSDLLPDAMSMNKLQGFIIRRLKEHNIVVEQILMVPNMHKHDEESVAMIQEAIEDNRNGRDVCLFGNANAGKSTMLNALLKKNTLTISRHPGTTLDLNPIPYDDYTLYDTPGIVNKASLLTHIDESLLKDVVITRPLNPKKFQLTENQTISVGGFVRLDLSGCKDTRVVCYFSDRLNVHRSKMENADDLWKAHLNKDILIPSLDKEFEDMKVYQSAKKLEKLDVAIAGLGWFCIYGNVKEVKVYVNKEVDVTFREAMV